MSRYDSDRHAYEQECTESMIRMRDPSYNIRRKPVTDQKNDALPDEIIIFRNSNGGLEFGPAPDGCDWLINTHYTRANKPHADDARKAHEWLESHVAMPHDIKTIVYSALSAASKEQSRGDE